MIKGKDKVLNFVRTNDAAYWTIYEYKSGSRTHCIFKSSQDPNLSLDQSIEKLENDLDLLESGRYMISCKQKTDDTKNLREIAFDFINEKSTATSLNQPAQTQAQGISMEELERRLREQEERILQRFEMDNLRKQNAEQAARIKELEGNTMDVAISGIAKRIDPFIEPMMNHFFPANAPAKVGVAGLPGNNKNLQQKNKTNMAQSTATTKTEISAEEATQRVQAALSQWQDADPERMILVIEKIAATAAQDPAMYNMYATMLLSK